LSEKETDLPTAKEKSENAVGMGNQPEIRSKLINLLWNTIYECLFNDTIKPALTFEEVQILQNRLNEWIEAMKFDTKIQMAFESNGKPINDGSYVK